MIFKKDDMLDVLSEFAVQCEEAYSLGRNIKVSHDIDKIVIAAMGGSAYGGDILRCYLSDINLSIPVFVNKDYSLPNFVDSKTLVFVISYSGNTEETISAYRIALRKSAQIVVITTGGKLFELANRNKSHLVQTPETMMPRLATGYMTIPMLNVLRYSRIGDPSIIKSDIVNTIRALRKDFSSKGKDFARRLKDKDIIVYGSERLYCIPTIWKKIFSENAKLMISINFLPEMNHNELESFKNLKRENFIVMIKDEEDYHKVKKRMDMTKKMASDYCDVTELKLTGSNTLSKIFTSVYLSQYISYHMAKDAGIDPLPIDIIEDFKKELR